MSAFFVITEDQIGQLAGEAAARHALPPAIVAAVIARESGGDVWSYNPEPTWRWFWNVRTGKAFRAVSDAEVASEKPPRDFPAYPYVDPDAEWWAQQASYGLMQPMGAVAREHGFTGKFLGALHDPWLNIDIGCRHLAGYVRRYLARMGWAGVLRAYNGGPFAAVHNTNPEYPEAIRAILGGRFPDA